MRAVSLYSGAGGLDVGFERAGFEIVFASEINHDAASTWMLNRPKNAGVMHEGDISETLSDLKKLKNIDIVFGGPPCQGFSVAGKMDEQDPRNNQIDTFMSIVGNVDPKAFLIENVKALATHQKWKSVREGILEKAHELGYSAKMVICCAADYGVSENRERVFFVGLKEGQGDIAQFEKNLARRRSKPTVLRDLLNSAGKFGSEDNPDTCPAKIVPAKKPVKRGSAYSGMLVNGSGRPLDLDSVAPTLTASMGGNKTPIIDQKALDDPGRKNWFEGLYKKIGQESYSDTKVPKYVRRLTLKEAALIQSFPSTYRFAGSTCSQYKQIGNAVPCKLAVAAARSIGKILSSSNDHAR